MNEEFYQKAYVEMLMETYLSQFHLTHTEMVIGKLLLNLDSDANGIAEEVSRSVKTIKNQISTIYEKSLCNSRSKLQAKYIRFLHQKVLDLQKSTTQDQC